MATLQDFQQAKRRMILAASGKIIFSLEKLVLKTSTIEDRPVFDTADFPWALHLENNWEVVRKEVEEILQYEDYIPLFQEISADQKRITDDDKWRTFFLFGLGYQSKMNCARCPETTRMLQEIPGMRTAFFSILSPRKHIPAHRGVYKGFLRSHLGLIVPKDRENCRMEVGGETICWEEGKCVVFDDTYRHEVWNDTDDIRVVLLFDVLRPSTRSGALATDVLIKLFSASPFVRDARKNQADWEQRMESVMAR